MTTTLTARGPEDLLAAVPVVLGFQPEESLVMLTFEAARAFHARVDLPPPDDVGEEPAQAAGQAVDELTDALLQPCLHHRVRRVVFVLYTADAGLSGRVAHHLRGAFGGAGIEVIEALRAHDGSWWRVPAGPHGAEGPPSPYDPGGHPFAAQAVFDGRVTHASREALLATLDPLPGEAELTRSRQAALGRPGAAEAGWLTTRLVRWVESRCGPSPDEAARVLWALRRVEVRDAALFALTRESAADHLRIWADLLRRAPDDQVAGAAVLTAFAAWQAGHGALAWCALDRCFEADPDHTLGHTLAECLTRAVPPSAWEEVMAGSGPDVDSA